MADAILANGMFSHYDRPRVAQLCEKAGLYIQSLKVIAQRLLFLVGLIEMYFLIFFLILTSFFCPVQHYSELPDIKRVIVNTHAIEPQVIPLN